MAKRRKTKRRNQFSYLKIQVGELRSICEANSGHPVAKKLLASTQYHDTSGVVHVAEVGVEAIKQNREFQKLERVEDEGPISWTIVEHVLGDEYGEDGPSDPPVEPEKSEPPKGCC